MRLCLLRHFEPDVAPGVCYGQTDMHLMQAPSAQTERLKTLRDELARLMPIDVPLFSSSLRRCTDIAAMLSPDFSVDDRLRELHFGEWEMQSWEAIGAQALNAWAADVAGFRPPGGETGQELQGRALEWLQKVAQEHDYAVAVTHAGVMRVLQAHHRKLPVAQWLDLRYGYGELLCLEFTDEQIYAAPVQ